MDTNNNLYLSPRDMSDINFAIAILNERRRKATSHSPLGEKLAEVVHDLYALRELDEADGRMAILEKDDDAISLESLSLFLRYRADAISELDECDRLLLKEAGSRLADIAAKEATAIREEAMQSSVPTCKVGDTVYQTDGVKTFASTIRNVIYETGDIAFDESAIGTSVFLSRVDAEAAMNGRR